MKTASYRLVGCLMALGLSAGAAAPTEEWVSLFDGNSLSGWHVQCVPVDEDKNYWVVEEGAITTDIPAKSKHDYIWLMSDGEYANFELRMKVQTLGGGNTGVQIRSRYDQEKGWLDGPQVDIHPPGPWRNGFIYDETREAKQWISPIVGPASMAKPAHASKGWKWKKADEGDGWNEVHIICKGTRIQAIMNGVKLTDYDGSGYLDDANHRKHGVGMTGHIALQIHRNNAPRVRFKDIQLKQL